MTDTEAPSEVAALAALGWALDRMTPYSHPAECAPGECICGWQRAVDLRSAPAPLDVERLRTSLRSVSHGDECCLSVSYVMAEQIAAKYARLAPDSAQGEDGA